MSEGCIIDEAIKQVREYANLSLQTKL